MGYVRPTLKLVFDEEHHGDLAGLEVRMKRASIDQLMRVTKLMALRGKGDADLTPADLDRVGELFDIMADRIIGWNLEEEDGTPVEPNADALRDQDLALVYGIITAWMEAVAGVPGPLAEKSPSGDPSLEASIPMDVQSLSLVS